MKNTNLLPSNNNKLSEDSNSEQDTSVKKLRVKELKGSSYVISLEKKDVLGEGINTLFL